MNLSEMMGVGVLVQMSVAGIQSLQAAQRSMTSLFVTSKGAAPALTAFGKAMVGVAAAAVAAKTGMAALNITMDNIETYAEFEFQMAHLEGLLGRNRDEMQGFTDAAYDMAIATRYTASESAEAMWEIASAGYEENEILDILPITAQAAAVGSMEMAEATDMLTSAMRSFQIPATEAEGTMDQMLTAMRLSKLHMDEFSSGFGRFGSVAAAANQDLSETLAIFGTFRTRGLSATRSATMVKMMLTHLMALSETERQMMHDMNVAIVDPMTGKFRGLLDIVEDLDQALPQISEAAAFGLETGDEDVLFNNLTDAAERRMRTLVDIWGMRAVASFYALTTAEQQIGGVTYRSVDAVRAVGREIENNTGATEEYYNSLLNTWQEQKRILKSTWDLIKVLLGGALAQAIRPWLTQIREFIDQIATFLRENPEIAKTIGYVVAIAGILLVAVGALILVGLIIAGIVMAVTKVGAAIVFGIPAAIAGLIALIIGGAYLIYRHWEEIKPLLKEMWIVVRGWLLWAWNFFKSIWPLLKYALAIVALGLLSLFAASIAAVGFLVMGIETIWGAIQTIYWWIYGALTGEDVSEKIDEIWVGITEDLEEIKTKFIGTVGRAFFEIGTKIMDWIEEGVGVSHWQAGAQLAYMRAAGLPISAEEAMRLTEMAETGSFIQRLAFGLGGIRGELEGDPLGAIFGGSPLQMDVRESGPILTGEQQQMANMGQGKAFLDRLTGTGGRQVNMGGVTINVNGTGYTEEDARELMRRLMGLVDEEMARVQ